MDISFVMGLQGEKLLMLPSKEENPSVTLGFLLVPGFLPSFCPFSPRWRCILLVFLDYRIKRYTMTTANCWNTIVSVHRNTFYTTKNWEVQERSFCSKSHILNLDRGFQLTTRTNQMPSGKEFMIRQRFSFGHSDMKYV